MFDILRGNISFSAEEHDIILLGHGHNVPHATALLGGHTPDQLARVVSILKDRSPLNCLGKIDIVSCNLGNNQFFISQLLRTLKSLNVETKLYFYNSLVSVSPMGEIMTETGGTWRSHNHRRRVVAELDQKKNVRTTVELGCTGPVLREYEGNVLYVRYLEWPSQPQMFVPKALRKKYTSIDCLEGLTWSLFYEEGEKRRAPDYSPEPDQRHTKAVWLTTPREDNIVFKHIATIQDLLVEIRYSAREEISSNIYYVLNECIYKVHWTNESVSLVGKFMNPDNQEEMEVFLQNFNDVAGSIQTLREGLKASKFHEFCRQTFQFQHCSYNCELWGQYFMAAVFSASVVNFRIFSLFLMSVIGCEVGRFRGIDPSLCTSFVGDVHPMMTDKPWPNRLQRGFYGGTIANYEMAPQDQQMWLDQVVAKENALYIQSKQIMNIVDHDEQTELGIFGKVKVMNKYVFSSYLEFFRGTPEGKRLKTGCTLYSHQNVQP